MELNVKRRLTHQLLNDPKSIVQVVARAPAYDLCTGQGSVSGSREELPNAGSASRIHASEAGRVRL